jgi:hypothetical protein
LMSIVWFPSISEGERLEWGTRHLLPVWQSHGRSHADSKAVP